MIRLFPSDQEYNTSTDPSIGCSFAPLCSNDDVLADGDKRVSPVAVHIAIDDHLCFGLVCGMHYTVSTFSVYTFIYFFLLVGELCHCFILQNLGKKKN